MSSVRLPTGELVALTHTVRAGLKPLGYQQLTGLSAATAFTNPPAGAKIVVISVETQAVRYRDDGTPPTASVGMPVAAGTTIEYTSQDFTKIKFIQQTAGAIVNASFYG